MTGEKRYYKIPFLKRKFYLQWLDGKFYRMGLEKKMTLEQAFLRLESKRIRRERKEKC